MKSVLFFALIVITACSSDMSDLSLPDPCVSIIEDLDRYQSGVTEVYAVQEAEIREDGCLSVMLQASGCDGRTWSASMIQGDVVLSPDQAGIQMRILLSSEEDCRGLVSKEHFFDIEGYRSYDYIALQGYDQPISI